MEKSTVVLSLGGSIIAPNDVDVAFLKAFRKEIIGYLEEDENRRLVLVCGGGAPARVYQRATREISPETDSFLLDKIGIQATRMNASLVRAIFDGYAKDEIVENPTGNFEFTGKILVAGGWKPGFSTDTDAVYLARKFGAKVILNLSNIKKVYTDDPKKNPDAKPIDSISWDDFIKMVGNEWVPGKNSPFDPIASGLAKESSMTVICADGRNIENTLSLLRTGKGEGTTIS